MTRARYKPKGIQLRSWAVGISIVVSTSVFLSYAVYYITMATEAESTTSPLPQLGDYTSPEAKVAREVALEYAASLRQSKKQPSPVIQLHPTVLAPSDSQFDSVDHRIVPSEATRLYSILPTRAKRLPSPQIIDNTRVKISSDPEYKYPKSKVEKFGQVSSALALDSNFKQAANFNLSQAVQPKLKTNAEDRDLPLLTIAATQEAPVREIGSEEVDGRGPYGMTWRAVSDLSQDDWVVYLRIQKTGSQTFWQTLQQEFDAGVWGRKQTVRPHVLNLHRY